MDTGCLFWMIYQKTSNTYFYIWTIFNVGVRQDLQKGKTYEHLKKMKDIYSNRSKSQPVLFMNPITLPVNCLLRGKKEESLSSTQRTDKNIQQPLAVVFSIFFTQKFWTRDTDHKGRLTYLTKIFTSHEINLRYHKTR